MIVDPVAAETALKDRISPVVGTLSVDRFPDNPREYVNNLLTNSTGAVLVAIAGLRRTDEGEADDAFGMRAQVTVLTPGLHEADQHEGAYPVVLAVIVELNGKRIVIEGEPFRMQVREANYTRYYAEGMWEWVIDLNLVPILSSTRFD